MNMRIAQVAPLYESVPPRLYGGTERVVSCLTEELVRRGHDVTLFASGDSATRARLVPICPAALRLDQNCQDQLAHHILMLETVFTLKKDFDLVHFHIDYLHYPLIRRERLVSLTTLHGRLDLPDLQPLYRTFNDIPVVSISKAQRLPLPWINWQATVYHGLPLDRFTLAQGRGGYLAFLGRICPEKGVEDAIAIAKRSGMRLRIAAKVDPADVKYFERMVKPLLDHPLIEFVGEIGRAQKNSFLGNASALLFPVQWPEPFGLVMIEAMACGTPVIAYPRGSVPEIVEDGMTGVVVHSITEAVAVLRRGLKIDRNRCRRRFEERFNVVQMATRYEEIYQQLMRKRRSTRRRVRPEVRAVEPQGVQPVYLPIATAVSPETTISTLAADSTASESA